MASLRSLIDLFKKQPEPLDVVSNNPAVLKSARARATLPQTQRLIRDAREAHKSRNSIKPLPAPKADNVLDSPKRFLAYGLKKDFFSPNVKTPATFKEAYGINRKNYLNAPNLLAVTRRSMFGVEPGQRLDEGVPGFGIPGAAPIARIKNVAGINKAANLVKKIHPEDLKVMEQFIDNVRLRGPENLDLELDAARIAEHYGLKMPKKANELANVFDDALSRIRNKQPLRRVGGKPQYLKDEMTGRFMGSKPTTRVLQSGFTNLGEGIEGAKETGRQIVAKIKKVVPLGRRSLQSADSTNGQLIREPARTVRQIPQDAVRTNSKLSQSSAPSAPLIPEAQASINKIVQALQNAKPLRSQQQRLYSIERGRRAGQVAAIGKNVSGEKGYIQQLSRLKGGLPKVDFEGVRGALQQADIDHLFNQVESANLPVFEKITAKGALAKILEGQLPTKNEISLMSEVFPREFVSELLSKRPWTTKLWEGVGDALAIPRTLMSSVDLSAPLRQGVFLVGRPKQWAPAFGDMFKYFLSPKAYEAAMQEIKARPTYKLMRESGLAITDMGPQLLQREERFMSNLVEKVPVVGQAVKASNRAYTGFLNKLRADVFDDIVRKAKTSGADTPELAESLATFVNAATGRGDLGALNRASGVLSTALFSPRLLASRLNLLNPVFYYKLEPTVRKEALKSLLTFVGIGSTVLALADLGGAEVGLDPRSSDFGKIKIGNTRYDIWGGFQQPIRLAGQLITNQSVSSTTGLPYNLGEGYKPTTCVDIVQRFIESKESPVVSFALGLARGENFIGDKFNAPEEVLNRFLPMVVQDIYEITQERGAEGLVLGAPAIFGVGAQTYGRQVPTMQVTPGGQVKVKGEAPPGLAEAITSKIFKPKPQAKDEISTILAELKAGNISRDAAKARIRQAALTDVAAKANREPEKLKPLYVQEAKKKLKSDIRSVVNDYTLTEEQKKKRVQLLLSNFKKSVQKL